MTTYLTGTDLSISSHVRNFEAVLSRLLPPSPPPTDGGAGQLSFADAGAIYDSVGRSSDILGYLYARRGKLAFSLQRSLKDLRARASEYRGRYWGLGQPYTREVLGELRISKLASWCEAERLTRWGDVIKRHGTAAGREALQTALVRIGLSDTQLARFQARRAKDATAT